VLAVLAVEEAARGCALPVTATHRGAGSLVRFLSGVYRGGRRCAFPPYGTGESFAAPAVSKSFLLLFFKKEVLAFCCAKDGLLRFARNDEGVLA
jgi:hypothetical protein